MICIRDKFSQNIGRQVPSKVIWDHLSTMYDMQALVSPTALPVLPDGGTNPHTAEGQPELGRAEAGVRWAEQRPLHACWGPLGRAPCRETHP